jgi:hypothetical protein
MDKSEIDATKKDEILFLYTLWANEKNSEFHDFGV